MYFRSLKVKFSSITFLFLNLLFFISPTFSFAQSITITSPINTITVGEGDDFAADQLNNPWDLNQRRDIGWEENFDPSSIAVNAGIWSAQHQNGRDLPTPGDKGSIFPLFAGIPTTRNFNPLPEESSLPHFGIKNKIDTSKYSLLSYRLNHTNRTSLLLSWEKDESVPDWHPNGSSPYAMKADVVSHYGFPYSIPSWNIYSFDLTNLSSQFTNFQGSWSGMVYTLEIEPSINANNASTVAIDWIRLVDPNSAPSISVTWNDTGITSADIITLFVDTDTSGYDGTPLAYFTDGSNPHVYSFPTAMLPPGTYYFYLTSQGTTSGSFVGPITQSNYSAALAITHKPRVIITAPSEISGEDYATTVLNNPWDMDGSNDVPNLSTTLFPATSRNFTNQSFISSTANQDAGLLFRATTANQVNSSQPLQAQVNLTIAPLTPIDPRKYRFLSFRMRADDTNKPSLVDKRNADWFSAINFSNSGYLETSNTAADNFVYEDWHTYSIDLWDNNLFLPMGWKDSLRLLELALFPLGTPAATQFEIDWVKLTADNHTKNNQTTIKFNLIDPDSSNLTVSLYYDTDNQNFNGTLITTLNNQLPGSHSYLWNTTGLTSNSKYYVYVIVSDGTNSSGIYSTTPITIGPFTPLTMVAPLDYDGDGKSDPTIYRSSNGKFYQKRSASGGVSLQWVPGSKYKPINADFDNDGKTDLALVFPFYGYLGWYIYLSSNNSLVAKIWGYQGDQIAVADYDGNGKDEIAVFRNGTWFILDENDQARVSSWGEPDDIPVPMDYDNDGQADLAIWRPRDGTWWILNSGYPNTTAHYAKVIQWGLPGDIPVTAYWKSDGGAGIGVYRPSLGTWFLRDLTTNQIEVEQWGLPGTGDLPVVADFNGDGRPDLTIFRKETGTWYQKFNHALWNITQWGLPTDYLPQRHLAP